MSVQRANGVVDVVVADEAEAIAVAKQYLSYFQGHRPDAEHALPVVVLCDTPGFMVGPEAEHDAGVRRFSRTFVVGANLQVPMVTEVTPKGYGLGAQAMMGGHLGVPVATVGRPTSELGPMGLEGAVRLGFRRELEAIDDPGERADREQQMIELAYANASGLNVASFGEIDDVSIRPTRVPVSPRRCWPPSGPRVA